MSFQNSEHRQVNRTKPLDILSEGVIPLISDLLESGFSVRIKVSGSSMAPYLKGGEIVTLQKTTPSLLKNGDIVIYVNDFGQPLLHRIVRLRKDGGNNVIVQTKGDGLHKLDAPIDASRILARVNRIENPRSIIADRRVSSSIELTLYRHRIIAALLAKWNLVQYYGYRIVQVCCQKKMRGDNLRQ